MQQIGTFTLKLITLVCPGCNYIFSSPHIFDSPKISKETVVEADLHEVYPDSAIRATLVCLCPNCQYAWWLDSFKTHPSNPKLVPRTPKIDHPKRFAHAILSGRKLGAHPYDLAMLALNGAWCAREDGHADERFLALALIELEKALKEDDFLVNYDWYHYLAGEACRQVKDFKRAVKHFEQISQLSRVPFELIKRQKAFALTENAEPQSLPPALMEQMYGSGEEEDYKDIFISACA